MFNRRPSAAHSTIPHRGPRATGFSTAPAPMRPNLPDRSPSLVSRFLLTSVVAVGMAACASEKPEEAPDTVDQAATEAPAFGPADGMELTGMDLERLQVGDEAPDFTLGSFSGGPVTLSDYRGESNVLLVFYRGHW